MGSGICRETLSDVIAMTSLRSNHAKRKLSRGRSPDTWGSCHSHLALGIQRINI